MEERQNVEVLYLGTITHENQLQSQALEKSNYQDQISFTDPVQVQLLRIPNNGKQLYSKLTSQTQKQPIKSLEIYYRNLDKKSARYTLLFCSSSELLVSSSDILVTFRETIFTDLLVIRGNFVNITLCIYGRVLRSKEEIDKKCPYFFNNIEVPLRQEQPSIKIHRNIFDESRTMAKAIQDEYTDYADNTQTGDQNRKVYSWDGFSNDRELYDSQITNICKLSQQLLVFDDLNHVQQRSVADIRKKLEDMKSFLQKLFKSAHIGLYYPTPYRPSAIPQAIPVTIVKIAIKLLPQSLSDQHRALEVLKLILQLEPHAQYFVKQGGIQELVTLFLKFFNSDLVIHSSLKALTIQVLIALSFWEFSVKKMVEKLLVQLQQVKKITSQNEISEESEEQSPEKEKSKSRSREKKKKKSEEKSSSREKKKNKKDKKSKKDQDKSKDRQKQRAKDKKKDKYRSNSKQKGKEKEKEKKKKQSDKQKTKQSTDKNDKNAQKQQKVSIQFKNETQQQTLKSQIQTCFSLYQILFKILKYQKNYKLSFLLKLLIQQITQTITKNPTLSNEMAQYTPLMRDTKYMFNQGGEMINSKSLKLFASFKPFLNQQQSKGVVESNFLCQSEKIKQYKKYGISSKLFKLIDSALTIIQSKSEDQIPLIFDQQFITLVSALIQNNKNGISIGLSNFIDTIKIDTLLGLKKQQAVIAIICEYIHEIFLQDQGMNLIYYMDQIHNSMLKIINWLKQDKTFSLEIKRKVQYLINSALIYNHLNNTENNFKSFQEYFTKLISHQHLDINKIVEYTRREYNKTVNPLTFNNLSQNFSLGNFYDVLPAQPLLEVDICLRMFLAILKLNKNIWTIFYEFKFVPAFSTLYLKIHSLLKFFLSPSLERQNAIIDIKIYERLINNYIQVAKHLTSIFICKCKYESAFNELIEQQDIFDTVQLYEKWIDTYLFLYNALNIKDSLISEEKTVLRIKQLLANFIELFDTVFKGYELTKNVDRQRNIRSLFKYIYRQHYATISYRAGIFSLLSILVSLAGPNTSQIIKTIILTEKNQKNPKDSYDILLPDNQKSIFENIALRNIYRSDPNIIQNLASLITLLIKKQNCKDEVFEILEGVLDTYDKEDLDENHRSLYIQKSTLYANLLSFVQAPFNSKIEQQMFRLLRSAINLRKPMDQKSQIFELRRLKLVNSYLRFFKSALTNNNDFPQNLLQQYLRQISHSINISSTQANVQNRMEQLKGTTIILETLAIAASNVIFQSIILYGEYLQKPYKSACQINLQKVFSYFKQNKNRDMVDEMESALVRQIGIAACLLLCKLTSLDGLEFYSTQCRKSTINALISPQKQFTLTEVVSFMEGIVPQKFIQTLKNYIDFPIVQKLQVVSPIQKSSTERKTPGFLYSKGVFTIISQNDPVGRARFQLIQDKWQGGDTQGTIYTVNPSLDYLKIAQQKILNKNYQIVLTALNHAYWQMYNGIHQSREVNNLFHFKIRKIFTQEAKKNALATNSVTIIKNIPNQIKKVQPIPKETVFQNKINSSPSLNRNMPPPISNLPQPSSNTKIPYPINMPPPTQTPPVPTNPQVPMKASSSNNREPSPYAAKNMTTPNKVYPPSANINLQTSFNPSLSSPITTNVATNPQTYYQNPNKNMGMGVMPVNPYTNPASKQYPTTMLTYDNPPPIYDPRTGGYYPAPNTTAYDPRIATGYPQANYMPNTGTMPGYIPPRMMNPPTSGYIPPQYPPTSNIYPQTRTPVIPPVTQPPIKQVEDEMANKAIQILLYLKEHPNVPESSQLKAEVNRLFQAPSVHERVTKYFQQLKRV